MPLPRSPRSSFMVNMFGMGATAAMPDYIIASPTPMPPTPMPASTAAATSSPPPSPSIPPILLWGGVAAVAYWLLFK